MNVLPNLAELLDPLTDRIADVVRTGWELQWRLQGKKTAAVLRYTETGGDPALGIRPALEPMPGLDAVPVVVRRGAGIEKTVGTRTKASDTEYTFVFYGMPLTLGDRVRFEDSVYEVREVDWNPRTGRCAVTARRTGPAGP